MLGASGAKTIEEAKAMAEGAYRGISEKWIHREISPEEARTWIRDQDSHLVCSFCGRLPMEVDGLVEGTNAAICVECIKSLHKNLNS